MKTLGFAVFWLLVARLVWRLFDSVPDAPPMPAWMDVASKVTHWALYALLFAVPATGTIKFDDAESFGLVLRFMIQLKFYLVDTILH